MQSVLITGGGGFIGQNLVHAWRAARPDDRLVVVDAMTFAANVRSLEPLIAERSIQFVRGDIRVCQISFSKVFVDCPYTDPLAIVMAKAYKLGNFNASLFATEGIASVGPTLAPFTTLACGLVIAVGNRLSAGLKPRFILISGAALPQVLLNVPLTIALLTNGAAFLFLLWYVTPRTLFYTGGQSNRPDSLIDE